MEANNIMQTDVSIHGSVNCKACKRCFCLHNSEFKRRIAITSAVKCGWKRKPLSKLWGTENKTENALLGLIVWLLPTRCFTIESFIDLSVSDLKDTGICFFIRFGKCPIVLPIYFTSQVHVNLYAHMEAEWWGSTSLCYSGTRRCVLLIIRSLAAKKDVLIRRSDWRPTPPRNGRYIYESISWGSCSLMAEQRLFSYVP